MPIIKTILKKEFKCLITSPIAYIYIISFLLFVNWYFFRNFFLVGQATLRELFNLMPWILLFLMPAISMRSWSEEKKSGTLDFLLTFPIHDHELVIGKFLASFLLLSLTILGTFPLVLIVIFLGSPDIGPIITGYIGSLLLGASYLAIGFFISSLTRNQIIAFIITLILCFFSYFIAQDFVAYALPNAIIPLLSNISLGYHYESMMIGIIDLSDIIFYISFIGFFLYLNCTVLASRKLGS
tara:strand:+ start:1097 stop:1816 length:720 start_codon:yes stop_codon:yes gene_type:complete